ncbi:MAG: hypothetical protein ACM3SQ_18790 [Betaproteobacteria bacterium]
MVRYLLGLLPEEEAEALDEQSFVDDELAARLCSVEHDLVDDYVNGLLDAETRERFESYYLVSPRRRERVRFAERFLDVTNRGAPATAAALRSTPSGVEGIRRFARRIGVRDGAAPGSWLVWPIAAALLLTCGILAFRGARLQRSLLDARRASVALDERVHALTTQLADQRGRSDAMATELQRLRAVRPATSVALVLLPQRRDVAPLPVIAVAPDMDAVPFQLRLETSDFSRYEAVLRDPATSDIIWRSRVLSPETLRGVPEVSVDVPARLLKPQHYSIELSGRTSAGTLDSVGSYAFQIEPR